MSEGSPAQKQATALETELLAVAEFDQKLYDDSCALLVQKETAGSTGRAWIWLLVTIVLFALSFLRTTELLSIGIVLLVLLIHEAGHFAGMRTFGYRNVRMFFIPFFGAAVAGQKQAAPFWQRAVVLLLGPLPGIVVGFGLALELQPSMHTWMGDLLLWLIALNAFNLLPFVPLDGGRLLDLLLFGSWPGLSVGSRLLATAGIGSLAYWTGSCVFWVLATFMLLLLPARYRQARIERAFKDNPLTMPERLEDLNDDQRRELFGWSRLFDRNTRSPEKLAASMRELHENMATQRLSPWSWCAVLVVYVGGIAASVAGGIVLKQATARHDEELKADLVRKTEETLTEIAALESASRRSQPEIDAKWTALLQEWNSQKESTRLAAMLELLRMRHAHTLSTTPHLIRLAEQLKLGTKTE
jgi:Zn-dependent protease